VNVTLHLSAASPTPVTVQATTADGTATAGRDYTAVAATTVTFPAGQRTATLAVPVLGDTVAEGNETFTVKLANSTVGYVGDAAATVTIVDEEGPIAVSVDDASVPEGDAGTSNMPFTVRLSSAPAAGQTVSVKVRTTDGSATAASGDY